MKIYSLTIFLLLLCSLFSCKLRIDNQQQEQESDDTPNPAESAAPIVEEKLPPMSEIQLGYYAMLVTGNTSPFIRGVYQGEATFARTDTPVINAEGISGNIKNELSFLYSQGLIRKLRVYFNISQLEVRNYSLIPYASFRSRMPKDSISATYIIASNYQFESRQGSLEVHKLSEQMIEGVLKGSFMSYKGDSIQVSLNFKAIRE